MRVVTGALVIAGFPILPSPASSFVIVPSLLPHGGSDAPLLGTQASTSLRPAATVSHCDGASRQQHRRSRWNSDDHSCISPSSADLGCLRRGRRSSEGISGPLRIGMGDCPSEEECEIVYDDDEDEVEEEEAGAGVSSTDDNSDVDVGDSSNGEDRADGGHQEGGDEGSERAAAAAGDAGGAQQKGGVVNTLERTVEDREGLEHKDKVLDDGYEKQEMLKWREAEVVENGAASADDRCRLLTLSLVGGEGLEYDFSRATWLGNYKVPGQFVGIRLDDGGDGGVAGCLVAVSTEPTSVRQNGGQVQVLVAEEPSFRLKGDTRGPAEEAKGRSLASLGVGDRVKISDFMGRGFASLFVGWIGLQSALQEQRDIVVVASGARGLGSVKPVLDWPPVQAHAGIKKVSVFVEAESPVAAPFVDEFNGWRSSGIRVTQCFTAKTNENPVSLEAAMFAHGAGLTGAVGGNPGAASFLMAGLPGKRAMELTDRLTDHGVDPSRLLFNDFF